MLVPYDVSLQEIMYQLNMRLWHDPVEAFSGSHSQVATFHNVIMLKSLPKVIPELKVHRRLLELGVWGDFSVWKTTAPSGSCICL